MRSRGPRPALSTPTNPARDFETALEGTQGRKAAAYILPWLDGRKEAVYREVREQMIAGEGGVSPEAAVQLWSRWYEIDAMARKLATVIQRGDQAGERHRAAHAEVPEPE